MTDHEPVPATASGPGHSYFDELLSEAMRRPLQEAARLFDTRIETLEVMLQDYNKVNQATRTKAEALTSSVRILQNDVDSLREQARLSDTAIHQAVEGLGRLETATQQVQGTLSDLSSTSTAIGSAVAHAESTVDGRASATMTRIEALQQHVDETLRQMTEPLVPTLATAERSLKGTEDLAAAVERLQSTVIQSLGSLQRDIDTIRTEEDQAKSRDQDLQDQLQRAARRSWIQVATNLTLLAALIVLVVVQGR